VWMERKGQMLWVVDGDVLITVDAVWQWSHAGRQKRHFLVVIVTWRKKN
jgi:hypothetical protein